MTRKECGRRKSLCTLNYCPISLLKVLSKIMKKFDEIASLRDSYPGPSEYEAGALNTEQLLIPTDSLKLQDTTSELEQIRRPKPQRLQQKVEQSAWLQVRTWPSASGTQLQRPTFRRKAVSNSAHARSRVLLQRCILTVSMSGVAHCLRYT